MGYSSLSSQQVNIILLLLYATLTFNKDKWQF